MVFDKKGACDMLAAGFVCYCSSVRIDHSKLDRNICFAFNRQFPMFLVNQQHAIRSGTKKKNNWLDDDLKEKCHTHGGRNEP